MDTPQTIMAKKVVSYVAIHKKKLMKHDTKKKRLLKKALEYLKSDVHMFAPLLSSHPTHSIPTYTGPAVSTGVEGKEPTEKVNNKLHKEVGEFLKSDCCMYAPLVTPQPWLCASICSVDDVAHTGAASCQQDAETGRERESMKKVSEDRKQQSGKARRSPLGREEQHLNGNAPRASTSEFRYSILQQETYKHIVQRKYISPSNPGKGSAEPQAGTRVDK